MFTSILFDIDGVMLSEERYFDASALTIHELISSPRFLGLNSVAPYTPSPSDEEISTVRSRVFRNDAVLERLKNVGVNANWDMVYFVFVAELARTVTPLLQAESTKRRVHEALQHGWDESALCALGALIRDMDESAVTFQAYDGLYGAATSRAALFDVAESALSAMAPCGRSHDVWELGQRVFQSWYLGDAYTGEQWGKKGFLTNEIAIVDPLRLQALLQDIARRGIHMGIATGRPRIETEVPLTHFGWYNHFDARFVTTASEVVEAEYEVPEARPLSKPHPFSYMRSYTGNHDVPSLLDMSLPMVAGKENILIVGDSIADGLAAQRMGASFAAVLTGLEGERARQKFEDLGAEYILSDVLALYDLL